jgi:glycosyltransferase involved in cell wall biosynthesis/SAM-dependent methyltransferase
VTGNGYIPPADPNRRVGVEARKTYAEKVRNGFIEKFLSGDAVLDIGYKGYESDVLPIVPQAIGVDFDYPDYDGEKLPFESASQDAVFSSHCLEHVDNARTAIREWFRVLKVGGFLVIFVPHQYLYERKLTPPSNWNQDHRRFYSPATLLADVEAALESNSYRVRHLIDNDLDYDYTIPLHQHPSGSYEIELVLQKIAPPPWCVASSTEAEQVRAPFRSAAVSAPTPNADECDLLEPPLPAKSVERYGSIIYDGLNFAPGRGTGIATYTRMLTRIVRNLGCDVGVVYGSAFTPAKDPLLREVLFFDQLRSAGLGKKITVQRYFDMLVDQLHCHFTLQPLPVALGKTVICDQFDEFLPEHDRAFVFRNLFKNANMFFYRTGKFVTLSFDTVPNVFHCTYPLPLRVKGARNVYTIHDLMPLRLPFATLDSKRRTRRLLKAVAARADHIVTVSETSKRDIIQLLGIDERRVTNTYQAVAFPRKYVRRPEQDVANFLDGLYGLEMRGYLLFFGALEPKKNVGRLIDAYLASGIKLPLVLVTAPGWQSTAERDRLKEHEARQASEPGTTARIRCLDYVDLSRLVNLVRGARAVIFPSLYEGFGLPVLESMLLGTPVVTSSGGALAEVAGEAALLVDPYDVDDITRAIRTITHDADLQGELSRRGIAQAAKFSGARYQERVAKLYASVN